MSVPAAVRAWVDATVAERIRAVHARLGEERGLDATALARFLAVAASLPPAVPRPPRPDAPADQPALQYYEEFVLPFFLPAPLLAALRTGRSQWQPFSEYGRDPAKLKRFMAWMDRRDAPDLAGVAAALPLAPGALVLDVGGGGGALAAAMLKAVPGLGGVAIYDLPAALPVLRQIFSEHHGSPAGAHYVGGSFLAAGPGLQGLADRPLYDVATLAWILHDWPDDDAQRILARVRRHLAPGGVVAVVEVLQDGAPSTGVLDLLMLLHTGGRERTLAEYAGLLTRAGFRSPRHLPLPGRRQLILAEG